MKVFPYCPMPGYSVESEPRRKVNKFGDGYQQRMVEGLNPLLRKYSLTFKIPNKKTALVTAFLAEHGGVKAFQFKECVTGKLVKVVCSKWSERVGKAFTELNCDFEEVV